MRVIADASPIILLSRVGKLDLLPALYGKVVVPVPVFQEVVVAGAERPGSRELQAAPWMEIVEADLNDQLLAKLCRDLDLGEAATLALAKALSADLVLIDDRQGRLAAASLGLAVKGTLGILVAAKREGHLAQVRPLLDALVEHGAWASPALKLQILAAAGERAEGPHATKSPPS